MTSNAVKTATEPTPMMRQYFEIKSQHQDAILFYRLGDFYEMFYEDAITASQILELTLTTRNKNDENPVPLCGIPYHAAESYITKLVTSGKKVVVCEQTEDPKMAKGIVKREVTRVITPGTLSNPESLEARKNNFVMAAHWDTQKWHLVVSDITTGFVEWFSCDSELQFQNELARYDAKELIFSESLRTHPSIQKIKSQFESLYLNPQPELYFDSDFSWDTIKSYWNISQKEVLGWQNGETFCVVGALLSALKSSKILLPGLLALPRERRQDSALHLDEAALTHLDLFKTNDGRRQGTLIWLLDRCLTPMGSRRLTEILRMPFGDKITLEERLDCVGELILADTFPLTEFLKSMGDLERLINRYRLGSANPRDAVLIARSLRSLDSLKALLSGATSKLICENVRQLNGESKLCELLESALVDDAPLSTRDGGLVRDGYRTELDELRLLERDGKSYIAKIEAREREATGISSLKIRYNNVFGYYIEITNTHKDKAPAHYIRKQTLSNAERYITDELKDYEAKVLGASERIRILESQIFQELCAEILNSGPSISTSARALAEIDVFLALADLAKKQDYIRPQLTVDPCLNLEGARHPVLELMTAGSAFVDNDLRLSPHDGFEAIITGPNMAGKSTIMRMTAQIVILAQIGSFVPCRRAQIGLCDRILTRVGAHDHLQKGLSTFMVEMVETARILREATKNSLIILDEIGRGTSTFDGLSIAWAVAEDIHDRLQARTLFATHYHELCDLAASRPGIRNMHMSVKEWQGEIIFLRKLEAGGSNRSYGVSVARMAGLSEPVIKRAREILKLLEAKDLSFSRLTKNGEQHVLPLFERAAEENSVSETDQKILEDFKNLDLNSLTPLAALNWLAECKKQLN